MRHAVLVLVLALPASASAKTLYVRDGGTGKGSRARPLGSLAAVQKASRPGDRIVVLKGAKPLPGPIKLKRRQRLVGRGVITSAKGDAVRLANRTLVRGITVAGAGRGGIYGRNVRRATVIGTKVSGHNTSCTVGFQIPPFNVPTLVPGAGVPISDGLANGWAGIMVDADRGRSRIRIARNEVGPADCGDGIDIRASKTADVRATITRNRVHDLREGADLQSVLAFGLQTRDTARLRARLDRNRQAGLGNDEDFGTGPSGADSEGVFVNPVGPSRLRATITRNRYTHTAGRGGFSANGLEYVTMGDGAGRGRSRVDVADSTFSGPPGDVIEQLALGTNAALDLRLDNVTATKSTGFSGSGSGDTVVIPGNNGDCLIGASGGAGNTVALTVRRSTLTDCANNGLTFGSSVANGSGPTKALTLDVSDTRITGNRGANLRVGNLSGLESLAVKVQRTDLADAQGAASSPANLTVEDLGTTDKATVDLGGGALKSAGRNCLDGNAMQAAVAGYTVTARSAWWGQPGGPLPGKAAGTIDTSGALNEAPATC